MCGMKCLALGMIRNTSYFKNVCYTGKCHQHGQKKRDQIKWNLENRRCFDHAQGTDF